MKIRAMRGMMATTLVLSMILAVGTAYGQAVETEGAEAASPRVRWQERAQRLRDGEGPHSEGLREGRAPRGERRRLRDAEGLKDGDGPHGEGRRMGRAAGQGLKDREGPHGEGRRFRPVDGVCRWQKGENAKPETQQE